MKKLLLVPLLILTVSSCSLLGNKNSGSFSDLYKANVHSSIVSLGEFGALIGINRHESVNGSINTAMSIPGIFSGSISSGYEGLIDGRNSESFFRDIRALFTSLVSSGSLSVDEVGLVSYGTDSYLSFKNLNDVGLIPDEIKPILKKYENTWLNIMGQAQEEMSAEELMGYNIGKNIFTKSLADIEKYATDYIVWKDTADLGMSGSLHFWSVELDRANIVALTKKLSLDLAGTGLTDEYVQSLETNLATLSFSGKIGFDPSNAKISVLDGTLSASGKLVAEIVVSKDENGGVIRVSNSEQKTSFALNYGKKDTKFTFDATVKQADLEMGKLTGYIEQKDGKFRELSIEASAQGMTVTLKHTTEGDKFNGKLSAVVGTLEWSGTVSNESLKTLVINGTAPFGTLAVNLTEGADGMARGPITVKSGEETLFSANAGLAIAREKFALVLDVLSESMPAHFELDITGKSTPSDKKVTAPTTTKSFQDFVKEIEAVSPEPEFVEDTSFSTEMGSGDLVLPSDIPTNDSDIQ